MIAASTSARRLGGRPAARSPARRSRAYGCADAGGAAPTTTLVPHRAASSRSRRPRTRRRTWPSSGRYVFTPAIFDGLDADAARQGRRDPAHRRHRPAPGRRSRSTATSSPRAATTSARSSTTCGPRSSWPLDRDDLGPEFRAFLAEFVACEGLKRRHDPDPARGGAAPTCSAGCPPLQPAAVAARRRARVRGVAERVGADEAVPPFANTAMDGFAVRAADTARRAGRRSGSSARSPAGVGADVAVGPGEAVRIMTGAPMPAGADAVVMVERTRRRPTATSVDDRRSRSTPGTTCGRPGDDLRPATWSSPPGTVLTPGHLGVLASVGVRAVPVVPPAAGRRAVDRRRAGRRAAAARARARSATPTGRRCWRWWPAAGLRARRPRPRARRRGRHHRGARARRSATCDALLTSGGVSMGDFDS